MHAQSLSHFQPCNLLCSSCPWNFPGKNTGVGSLSLLEGNLPNPGIEPTFPALTGRFLTSSLPAKPSLR